MKVLKFGGTSVGTVESLRNVKQIVDSLQQPGIIVVSALGGLTDGLISTARMAADGDEGYKTSMRKMADRHFEIINTLIPTSSRSEIRQEVAEFLSQLEDIYMGLTLIGFLPDKVLNRIVSFGERMSSIMVANILRDAEHADPLDFMKTRKEYGKDVLAAEQTRQLITERFPMPLRRTVVTGGFISRDLYSGEITNLGRGGSDYTAALIASALGADVLEIWTDVDGFMTADPRIVKDAKVIDSMSYPESMVLCQHGAKVIYPPTIRPAFENNIPMKVLNTHNPSAPGTLIDSKTHERETCICGLACMKDVAHITVATNPLLAVQTLRSHGIDVVSSWTDPADSLTHLVICDKCADISAEILRNECKESEDGGMRLIRQLAMLTPVGHDMDRVNGLRQSFVDKLAENGVGTVAANHAAGSDEDYTELLVRMADMEKSMQVLHKACYGANA